MNFCEKGFNGCAKIGDDKIKKKLILSRERVGGGREILCFRFINVGLEVAEISKNPIVLMEG